MTGIDRRLSDVLMLLDRPTTVGALTIRLRLSSDAIRDRLGRLADLGYVQRLTPDPDGSYRWQAMTRETPNPYDWRDRFGVLPALAGRDWVTSGRIPSLTTGSHRQVMRALTGAQRAGLVEYHRLRGWRLTEVGQRRAGCWAGVAV